MQVSDEFRRVLIDEIWETFEAQIPTYAPWAGTEVEGEVRAASLETIACYERLLAGIPPAQAMEVIDFGETVVNRLQQDFDLPDLLSAARLECATIWRHFAGLLAGPAELIVAGAKLVDLIDITSSGLERRYGLELERLRDSRSDAVELFVRRVVSEELLSDMTTDEALLLGYDVTRLQTAVVVALRAGMTPGGADLDDLDVVASALRRRLPLSLTAVFGGRLYAAVPGTLDGVLADLLAREMRSREQFSVGVGSAYPGPAGLRKSFMEAARARAIAGIMYPDRVVAVYSDLSVFNIFSEGPVIDAFVQEVLGPLLRHDRTKGSRLVRTLEVFYGTGMNRKATATQLSIHANTLDYRLRQVETILPSYSQGAAIDFRLPLALKLLPNTSLPLDFGSPEAG